MKKIIVILITLLTIHHSIQAQYAQVFPTNWWVGMKWNKVQLLIKGGYAEFNKEQIKINYPGVKIEKINKLDNGLYIVLMFPLRQTQNLE
jgi:hypothetical protein